MIPNCLMRICSRLRQRCQPIEPFSPDIALKSKWRYLVVDIKLLQAGRNSSRILLDQGGTYRPSHSPLLFLVT